MGILSARSLTQALSQARHIGLVEEPFVVGDMSVVVRNLRPDQYDAIFKECQGLSEIEYLNTWQMAHVCRAICEINGQDLRDVQYVEDEEPDPKRAGQTKAVKLELHSWLKKNVLATWSREAVYIVYRKVADAIEAAEKKAQEGITFRVDEESPEDKFRRLIGEIKEIEGNVPERILDTVLKDAGYMRRATMEEIEAVEQKLAKVAEKIEQAKAAPAQPAPEAPPVAPPVEATPTPEPTPSPEPTADPIPAQRASAGPPSPGADGAATTAAAAHEPAARGDAATGGTGSGSRKPATRGPASCGTASVPWWSLGRARGSRRWVPRLPAGDSRSREPPTSSDDPRGSDWGGGEARPRRRANHLRYPARGRYQPSV